MAVRGGWCDEELRDDFPGIGIVQASCVVTRGVKARLRRRMDVLSGRIDGRNAASLPLEAVPSAYRALARQLGLDPEEDGTPLARLLRERIRLGRLPTSGFIADAGTCALLETGVPVFGLPAGEVAGDLGLALARPGDVLPGDDPMPLAAGAVVISDLARPVALALLAPPIEAHDEGEVVLYAVRAPGVADLVAEEALWVATGLLQGSG